MPKADVERAHRQLAGSWFFSTEKELDWPVRGFADRAKRGGLFEVEPPRSEGFPSKDAQSEALQVCWAPWSTVDLTTDWNAFLLQKLVKYQLLFLEKPNQVTITWRIRDTVSPEPSSTSERVYVADPVSAQDVTDSLTAELLQLDATSHWARLRDLILLAEDAEFTAEQSKELGPRLLDLAIRHRDTNDKQDEAPVWAAIRTGASMLRPTEAKQLLPLLEPGHSVETSLVALKMLGRIFEAQPPSDVDHHPELAKKVMQIAKSLLDRYAIASRQSAAMAQLAVYALAAMASSDLMKATSLVRTVKVDWFMEQTARELRGLSEYWTSRVPSVAASPRQILDRALQALTSP